MRANQDLARIFGPNGRHDIQISNAVITRLQLLTSGKFDEDVTGGGLARTIGVAGDPNLVRGGSGNSCKKIIDGRRERIDCGYKPIFLILFNQSPRSSIVRHAAVGPRELGHASGAVSYWAFLGVGSNF